MNKQQKLKKARELASQLFDLKLIDLEKMSEDQQKSWMAKYSMLSKREFEDIRQQVIQAKTSQQSQIGWQTIPHDLSVIIFCLVSVIFSLKVGLIAGVFLLILLESLFQVFYNPKLYQILGYSVWLTYPAYILLGYILLQRGLGLWQIAGILVLAWGGTYLLGMLAAIPMQLYLKARAQTQQVNKGESKGKNKAK